MGAADATRRGCVTQRGGCSPNSGFRDLSRVRCSPLDRCLGPGAQGALGRAVPAESRFGSLCKLFPHKAAPWRQVPLPLLVPGRDREGQRALQPDLAGEAAPPLPYLRPHPEGCAQTQSKSKEEAGHFLGPRGWRHLIQSCQFICGLGLERYTLERETSPYEWQVGHSPARTRRHWKRAPRSRLLTGASFKSGLRQGGQDSHYFKNVTPKASLK